MGKLIAKEFKLVVHPSSYVLIATGALVLIPSWPYAVIAIWGLLPAFFNSMAAREMHDFKFSFSLPVSRRQIAAAKVVSGALLQLAMVLVVVVCVAVKGIWWHETNPLGLGANFAFAGVLLAAFGVFNFLYYPLYLRNPDKVGVPFVIACASSLLVVGLFQAASYFPGFSLFLAGAPYDWPFCQFLVVVFGGTLFFSGLVNTVRTASAFFEQYDA
jgi:hypothetical protein